ncbi:Pr6Pr family membrane protein [Catellatospora sichuanensis]|uniref:Pr6Pr family membrane protein n=1 Tax=Catellatospora sichuanensis TaxID=1969805 RepID=UPI0011831F6B|nr:Pr6Pr family membrane protein [Catellatospora sichuanensis]
MPIARALRALTAACALAGVVLLLVDTGGGPGIAVYFTVQSNLIVAAVFGLAAFGRGGVRLRGAATLYIAITGTVYHLVLTNPASPFFTADPGADTMHNLLLHTATPLLAAIDWLLVNRERVRWWHAGAWLAYPLAYLAFALVRGALTGSYPYPFIDVAALGYGAVAVNAVVFSVLFFLLGLLLIGLGELARRVRRAPAAAPGAG